MQRLGRTRTIVEISVCSTDPAYVLHVREDEVVQCLLAKGPVEPFDVRARIERVLRLARATEEQARNKLARLGRHDPKRAKFTQDLQRTLERQKGLEVLRPGVPTHAPVCETGLADKLVQPDGAYKTVIDTPRIALANMEADLASELAPHLCKPREAKKTLANLLAAPGTVRHTPRTVTVTLAPAATTREKEAFASLLAPPTRERSTGDTEPGPPSSSSASEPRRPVPTGSSHPTRAPGLRPRRDTLERARGSRANCSNNSNKKRKSASWRARLPGPSAPALMSLRRWVTCRTRECIALGT